MSLSRKVPQIPGWRLRLRYQSGIDLSRGELLRVRAGRRAAADPGCTNAGPVATDSPFTVTGAGRILFTFDCSSRTAVQGRQEVAVDSPLLTGRGTFVDGRLFVEEDQQVLAGSAVCVPQPPGAPGRVAQGSSDVVGVGVAFRAGFLWGLHARLSFERAAQIGCTLAAVVLENVRTQEYALDRADLSDRLAKAYDGDTAAEIESRLRV